MYQLLLECHQKSTKQRVPTGYNQPAIHLFKCSKDRECSLLSLVIFFRSWINNAESELKFKDPTKTNISKTLKMTGLLYRGSLKQFHFVGTTNAAKVR